MEFGIWNLAIQRDESVCMQRKYHVMTPEDIHFQEKVKASAETNPAHSPWPWMSYLLNWDSCVTPQAVLLDYSGLSRVSHRQLNHRRLGSSRVTKSEETRPAPYRFRFLLSQWIDDSTTTPNDLSMLSGARVQGPELEFPWILIFQGISPWVFYVPVSVCSSGWRHWGAQRTGGEV